MMQFYIKPSDISFVVFYLSILAILVTIVLLLQFFIAERGGIVLYSCAAMAYVVCFLAGLGYLFQSSDTEFFSLYYIFTLYFFIAMLSVVMIVSAGSLLPDTPNIMYNKSNNLETHKTNFFIPSTFNLSRPAEEGTYVSNNIFSPDTTSLISVSSAPGFDFYTQKSSDSSLEPTSRFSVTTDGLSPKIIVTVPYDSNLQWATESKKMCRFNAKQFENITALPFSEDGIYLFCLSQADHNEIEPDNCGFCLFMKNKIIYHWTLYPNIQIDKTSLKYKTNTTIKKATLWKMTCNS
jgi:hypothetical protein